MVKIRWPHSKLQGRVGRNVYQLRCGWWWGVARLCCVRELIGTVSAECVKVLSAHTSCALAEGLFTSALKAHSRPPATAARALAKVQCVQLHAGLLLLLQCEHRVMTTCVRWSLHDAITMDQQTGSALSAHLSRVTSWLRIYPRKLVQLLVVTAGYTRGLCKSVHFSADKLRSSHFVYRAGCNYWYQFSINIFNHLTASRPFLDDTTYFPLVAVVNF